MAMGAQPGPLIEVPDQPVRHLVGHHLDQKRLAVLGVKLGIEAQPAAPKMCLAGALAPQVEPYLWPRQGRMDFTAKLEGVFDPLMKARLQRRSIQRLELFGKRRGQNGSGRRWGGHGMLEWRAMLGA